MLTVGLTGGLASGKSAVARRLAHCGAGVVDTDAHAHALTAPGGAAIEAIRTRFGTSFINATGALDRASMRAHVFGNDRERRALEAILHPLIRAACDAEAAALAARGIAVVVFDVPLLVEAGNWTQRVGRVLVVDCSVATQLRRAQVRSGLTPAEAQRIVAAQASRAARLAAAHDVLVNESTLDDLHARVDRLYAAWMQGLHRGGATAPV